MWKHAVHKHFAIGQCSDHDCRDLPSTLLCEPKKSVMSSARTNDSRRPYDKVTGPPSSSILQHNLVSHELHVMLEATKWALTPYSRVKLGPLRPKSRLLKLSGSVIACIGAMRPSVGRSTSPALKAYYQKNCCQQSTIGRPKHVQLVDQLVSVKGCLRAACKLTLI